jgi:hypothetical protein
VYWQSIGHDVGDSPAVHSPSPHATAQSDGQSIAFSTLAQRPSPQLSAQSSAHVLASSPVRQNPSPHVVQATDGVAKIARTSGSQAAPSSPQRPQASDSLRAMSAVHGLPSGGVILPASSKVYADKKYTPSIGPRMRVPARRCTISSAQHAPWPSPPPPLSSSSPQQPRLGATQPHKVRISSSLRGMARGLLV